MPEATTVGTPTLSAATFKRIAGMVYQAAGINLVPAKEALVISRLARKLAEHGCTSFEEYASKAARKQEVLADMVDTLTTNYTAFLREPAHFDFLQRVVLPQLSSRARVSIWCAAAATGEEPYSLAFAMLEALGQGAEKQVQILATDISTRALEKGKRGIYPAKSFAAVPESWLRRYLLRGEGSDAGWYQVKPEVRRLINFQSLNLVQDFDPGMRFPLISCRNVMIYFDAQTQQRVVERMVRFLEPGGYFFLGHAESLTGMEHSFDFVQPATYRLPAGVRQGRV
jgi:chemotaxis protein methyltransferase CheR